MALLTFDELNAIETGKQRSQPYDKYFGEMALSDSQKAERTDFARHLEGVMTYVLFLASSMIENESIDRKYLADELRNGYLDVVAIYAMADEYTINYANSFSKQITDATFDNDAAYFLSGDRARFVSEEEANTFFNYLDNLRAREAGKKSKKWIDIRDTRERKTHLDVGGTTIPIDEPFRVGGSLLMFPKDMSLGAAAKEIVNCRCSVKYY